MSEAIKELIKNIFVLVGIGSLIYWTITLLPPYYNKEKYQSACADSFGYFGFKLVDNKLYCKVGEDEWRQHDNPPQVIKYNIWGQEIK